MKNLRKSPAIVGRYFNGTVETLRNDRKGHPAISRMPHGQAVFVYSDGTKLHPGDLVTYVVTAADQRYVRGELKYVRRNGHY